MTDQIQVINNYLDLEIHISDPMDLNPWDQRYGYAKNLRTLTPDPWAPGVKSITQASLPPQVNFG